MRGKHRDGDRVIINDRNTTKVNGNSCEWAETGPLPAYLTGKNYTPLGAGKREERRAFPSELLDEDAVRVVQRLSRANHVAYFVGGCVRDLLLERTPKDFDIGTSARPRQVKKLFRNCWIIGRRFKLAHVNFGTKTIEVSTFRAFLPETFDTERTDLLIKRDNLFGSPGEDAWRRDFTINGLFYDLSRKVIIDHVGGLEDVENRIIRTIGDPEIRLREDPVRILRAIKFASRLSFHIEPATYEAMVRHAPDIARCAAPRVLEEILRILRGGAAKVAFDYFRDTEVLQILLPEVHERLRNDKQILDRHHRLLESLDALVHSGHTPSAALCLAALFLPAAEGTELVHGRPKTWEPVIQNLNEMLDSFCPRLNVPRRDAGRLRDIVALQKRMRPSTTKRRFTRASLARHPSFPDALAVFRIYCGLEPEWSEELERWEEANERIDRSAPRGESGRGSSRRSTPNRSSNGQKKSSGRGRRRRRRSRSSGSTSSGS